VVAQKATPQTRQPDAVAAVPAAGSGKAAPQPRSETSKEKPAAVSAAGKKELQNKKPVADKKQAVGKKPAVSKGTPPPYNPEGKIDPFKPLFKEKPDLPEKRSRPKRIPRTPLERVALSQLKLTAIIMAPSGNRALVQEASGKGYVIENGTYIGLNAGKVVEIQKDRVIIEEEVEDIVGKLIKRKQQLKLPKPAEER
jgi:type IV pilus assembly protein PilP